MGKEPLQKTLREHSTKLSEADKDTLAADVEKSESKMAEVSEDGEEEASEGGDEDEA
jgi:hypothetical protein